MRVVLESRQVQAFGLRAERVAERTEPQHHVESALVTGTVGQHRGQLLGRTVRHRRVRIGDFAGQRRGDHLIVDECGVGVGAQPEGD